MPPSVSLRSGFFLHKEEEIYTQNLKHNRADGQAHANQIPTLPTHPRVEPFLNNFGTG